MGVIALNAKTRNTSEEVFEGTFRSIWKEYFGHISHSNSKKITQKPLKRSMHASLYCL